MSASWALSQHLKNVHKSSYKGHKPYNEFVFHNTTYTVYLIYLTSINQVSISTNLGSGPTVHIPGYIQNSFTVECNVCPASSTIAFITLEHLTDC